MKITMEQVTIQIPDRPELLGLAPVVRCRECKYYYPQNRGVESWVCEHAFGLPDPQDHDFCSYGERREGR
ncbi:hypothetical protein AAK912_10415 [Merdimmobilis hominis]|uniref:hypothetical protein n=1 Tax=Merdimmobilis hominis TaxID=2897707 RepID=UPI0035185DE6